MEYLWDWDKVEPLDALMAIFMGNSNDNSHLVLGQLWFLPALLAAETIFVTLYNRLNKYSVEIFTVAIVFCSYVGFSIKNFFFLPLGIDIALISQIFLLTGILIRRNNFIDKLSLKSVVYLTLVVVFVFYFNEHISMTFRHYGEPIPFYAGALAGTLITMKLSSLMTSGKIFSLISSCGRQSMIILVLHTIIANALYEIIAHTTDISPELFFEEPTIIFVATVTSVLIPLFIARRFGKLPVLRFFCP